MQRYRFGKEEYKYFNYQLPPTPDPARIILPSLSILANEWMRKLSIDIEFPDNHAKLRKKISKAVNLSWLNSFPRAQSKAEVVQMNIGEAMIFTTNFRPVQGTRGFYRARMKQGISQLRSGISLYWGLFS